MGEFRGSSCEGKRLGKMHALYENTGHRGVLRGMDKMTRHLHSSTELDSSDENGRSGCTLPR